MLRHSSTYSRIDVVFFQSTITEVFTFFRILAYFRSLNRHAAFFYTPFRSQLSSVFRTVAHVLFEIDDFAAPIVSPDQLIRLLIICVHSTQNDVLRHCNHSRRRSSHKEAPAVDG